MTSLHEFIALLAHDLGLDRGLGDGSVGASEEGGNGGGVGKRRPKEGVPSDLLVVAVKRGAEL